MTGRLAFSPAGFSRQPQRNAGLKLWLILPEAGPEALDLSSRNEGFDLFSPPLKRLPREPKKDRPVLILHSRCGPHGCGPDRPRQLIAIEAAMVVASKRKNQGE
jgi:hypothetical protein